MSRLHWRLDPEVCFCRGNIISHMLLFRLMVLLFSRGNCKTASNVHTKVCTLLRKAHWMTVGWGIHLSASCELLCVQLWFDALIDCQGNGYDGRSQACIWNLSLSTLLCLWGIYTNHHHKALIYLGYGSLLAPASFYLSPLDERAQSRSSL